ncbi:efflux RND transporter permease subunit [Nostoc favosum]|uniref:Efflux RND transporter permease subunit n=1 Tax=Nostoc favosum CHAB5714 TaxID=2780399 RepID=A0ABS8ICB1_9NOSO|nr:efflux RND transporter permease subunit [Nostoc favosum]MCC5601713.1 efflux RND transporter permease subunit [Nostoc favosum CHAB5714]
MFVNTFIRRPVLTTVCTFIILLLRSICIPILPISQLPDLAPVQITVSSNNIGADAQTTESTVTNISAPIETLVETAQKFIAAANKKHPLSAKT